MLPRLGLHLTDRCQLDCDHCLRDPGDAALDFPIGVLPSLLRDARALYGISQVSFTGGEPTLHPRFMEVLDVVADASFEWDMVTNGRRFARVLAECEERPARRAALRTVTFSLDGADARTHDSIRGEGSYREVLGSVAVAVASGVRFGIQMAVHARNKDQIEQMGLLAAQLGAARVSFSMTQPTGTPIDETLFLPAAEWATIHARIEALSSALSIDVLAPDGYPQDGPVLSCTAAQMQFLHVDVKGRLSLCCVHAGIPGPDERSVAGSVETLGLVGAHRRLISIVQELQAARFEAVADGELRRPWGRFQCNWCLAHAGRPHWTDTGSSGARALRPRWSSIKRRLPLLPADTG